MKLLTRIKFGSEVTEMAFRALRNIYQKENKV